MTASDWAGVVGAACAVAGLILVGVRAIVKSAVKDDKLTNAFLEHKAQDLKSFSAIDDSFTELKSENDRRFAHNDQVMTAINERSIRTDEKVNLLVEWQTGANPEARKRRTGD